MIAQIAVLDEFGVAAREDFERVGRRKGACDRAQVFLVSAVVPRHDDRGRKAGVSEGAQLVQEGLKDNVRRQRREARIDVAHDLAKPGRVIAGLVDMVGHGRSDDPAEAARGLVAEIAGLDRVEPERRDMAVGFAKPSGR